MVASSDPPPHSVSRENTIRSFLPRVRRWNIKIQYVNPPVPARASWCVFSRILFPLAHPHPCIVRAWGAAERTTDWPEPPEDRTDRTGCCEPNIAVCGGDRPVVRPSIVRAGVGGGGVECGAARRIRGRQTKRARSYPHHWRHAVGFRLDLFAIFFFLVRFGLVSFALPCSVSCGARVRLFANVCSRYPCLKHEAKS